MVSEAQLNTFYRIAHRLCTGRPIHGDTTKSSKFSLMLQKSRWIFENILHEVQCNKIAFIRQGATPSAKELKERRKRDTPRPQAERERAVGGRWSLCADLPGRERRFPIPTTKKPDMVVWCEDEKEIHIVKLTEPHEYNVAAAHD